MAPIPAPTILSSVDDYLGPAAQRFFGKGFRRVEYEISDIESSCNPDSEFRANAVVGVRYPQDWSRKGTSRDLRPHFSTIDAIVLGADLSTLCLADANGMDAARAGRALVRTVRITAGNRPQENLDRLPVIVTGQRTGDPRPGTGVVTETDCRIGTMRVRCGIEHDASTPVPGTRKYADPADLLGPADERYHGSGFTAWQQDIRDVRVDHADLRADATLVVAADRSSAQPVIGLPAGVSLVDGFVTTLQLAQILLYELDGIRREDSETLWMRQTTMSTARPDPTAATGSVATTRLENAELIEMAGGFWRTADIVGDVGGVQLRCAVTHRLPAR